MHRALDTIGAAIGPLMAFAILWWVPGDYRAVFVASLAAALARAWPSSGCSSPTCGQARRGDEHGRPAAAPSWRSLADAAVRPRRGGLGACWAC